jgi:hypothetical protein
MSDSELDDYFRKIRAYSYNYRPDWKGKSDARDDSMEVGPMAQDLEASGPFGKALVREGDDGYLRVDASRAALQTMGEVGNLRREADVLRREQDALRKELYALRQTHPKKVR